MNDNTIIENVKKELNRIYKYATNINVKNNKRTFYDQAFGIIELEGSREYCEKRLPDFPGAVIEWKCY